MCAGNVLNILAEGFPLLLRDVLMTGASPGVCCCRKFSDLCTRATHISHFSKFPIKLRNPCASEELQPLPRHFGVMEHPLLARAVLGRPMALQFLSEHPCGGGSLPRPLPAQMEPSPPFSHFWALPLSPAPSNPAGKGNQGHKNHPGSQANPTAALEGPGNTDLLHPSTQQVSCGANYC